MKKFLLAGILTKLMTPLLIFGQGAIEPAINSTLSGRITDFTTKSPLPNAVIRIKGTTHEVIADDNGRFNFRTGQKFPYIIEVTHVGFEKTEFTASSSTIEIQLKEQPRELGEVVVVGYGNQEKKTLSSAISRVAVDNVRNIPAAGVDQLLQGQAGGVLSTANSSVPGSGIFLRVRGSTSINASNDPLYVVDGIFINNRTLQSISTGGQQTSPIADINPADIESIDILKDADATAIYGSRGANGVILITTRHGKLNAKSKVNIGYYYASSDARKSWPVLTGAEEGVLQNETWANDGKPFSTRPFRPKPEGGLGLPEEQPTVDRLGLIFQNAPAQNFDASVSGGNEKTTYYIGGNFFSQEAIVKPDKFQRITAKVNLEQQLGEKVKIGISINGISTKRNMSPNNNVPYGALNGALYTPRYFPLFNEDGTYARPSLFENPIAGINELRFSDVGSRAIGNLFGEYNILKGLKFKTSWSIDFNESKEDNYFNSKMQQGQAPINGSATSALARNSTLINEQVLSYNKTFNQQHYLNIIAGNTIQKETFETTSISGTGFPTDQFTRIASAAVQTGSSSFTSASLVSYFGRASYTYNKKYTLDLNFRADASSRFGADNRWGYFPAAGISWRAGQEDFIKDLGLFSDLKLRASYGSTGNQNGIPDFASKGLWSGGNTYLNVSGIAPFQLANPDLKWETTKQLNLGIDVSLLKNRVSFEFNYYRKYTTDLLLELPVASQLGFSSIFANAGEMSNNGFELTAKADIISGKNFSWQSSFSISTNKNKVEKLQTPILKSGGQGIIQEGYPLYSFYLHKQFGVDPKNGDVLFDDVNKDGKLSDADLQILGNAWPAYFGGFTNNFTFFQNFDAGVFIYYSVGNKVWNNTRYRMGHGGSRNGVFAMLQEELTRWQKPGDITETPRLTASGNNASIIPSRFLEDGSFIRLKNVSIGYNLPGKIVSRLKLSAVRIYLMATNLVTITKYKGVDPEVNTAASDQNVLGYDQAIAPQPRTLQAGFNISF
ncbi:MAG TPA: TonB-dependent receptor [Chitinophagaceae bacterium]|nr:TonB-dependent receptor [Chitinophagaceae bacterium]